MVEDEVEAGNAAASCLAWVTDAGGVAEVMGQPAAENVVLGCRYGELTSRAKAMEVLTNLHH